MNKHLAQAISKMKDLMNKGKKPPRGKNDSSFLNNSVLHQSIDKNAFADKLKLLQNSTELNLSKGNDSVDVLQDEEKAEEVSRNKLRSMLGRSMIEADNDKSRNDSQNLDRSKQKVDKSKTPDRLTYIHEPHDCLYR